MEDIQELPSHKVGIVLILTLLLPYTWTLIPDTFIWYFPFFDESTDGFALHPIEYRTYPFNAIIPFYQFGFMTVVYTYCRGISQHMHVQIFRRSIDIWFLYLLYTALQLIDLFIAFLQFPYYRRIMTVIILFAHIKYLINKK